MLRIKESHKVTIWVKILDLIGMAFSAICVVHCVGMALLFSLPFLFGHLLIRYEKIETITLCLGILVAGFSMSQGWKRHRRKLPAFLTLLGFVLAFSEKTELIQNHYTSALGVALVALSHWLNLKFSKNACLKTKNYQ